jgi:TetR/AcrR family transcriptional repressor of nem operon
VGRTSTGKDRLIDAAYELIYTRGYVGVGVADICARAGVLKGSFYHFFPSKQALALAAVDAYWDRQRDQWTRLVRDDERPPLRRLRELLAANVAAQVLDKKATGSVRGCMLGNLALEVSGQDEPVQARIDEVFAEQIRLVHGVLVAAADAGVVGPEFATLATARAVVAQLEGLVLFAKLTNDPAVFDDLWPLTLRLLGLPVDASDASGGSEASGGARPGPSTRRRRTQAG